MKFGSFVFFIIISVVMGTLLGSLKDGFGKGAGELVFIGIMVCIAILPFVLVARHNKKVLRARAEIARKADDAHKAKLSKDWV
ncbi:MAG: hypothetical protein COB83_09780 [Gammaproteobacteria bacterium]|nr:MAG: hypothetical protein COB83_09780 [Gammaproteobacteria bacterium]